MNDGTGERQAVKEDMRRRLRSDFEIEENMIENVTTIIASFTDVATALADREDKELGLQVLSEVKDLIQLRERVKYHRDVIVSLADSYECPDEGEDLTDFDEIIKGRVNDLMATSIFRPESTAEYKSLMRELGTEADGLTQELEEDEDIIIDSASGLAPNAACPLSRKPILEIDDPVEDAKGIVYERALIEASLSREPSNSHVCPEAGTTHIVRLKDLVPARRVMRERKRQYMLASGETEDKPDVEEDDVL